MIRDALSRFFESTFRDDRVVLIVTAVTLALNLGMWVGLYLALKDFSYLSESGRIPLHFSANFGIDSFGPWYGAFAIPLLGISIYLFNVLSAYLLYYKDKYLSYVLLVVAAAVQALLAVASYFVVYINS